VYRLLAKLITNRLQPHIHALILPRQSAFVRGRCIIDNTILMREVVHTFQNGDYREPSFALKADINKAFDTIEWPFIRKAMEAIGIPTALVELIMSCIGEGRITVLINGKGDGFFQPTCGLRQGCPLSPYLFIMAMEFLSKSLNQALQ
jgi:Reverse transcriptase (RNA-dependent DNA polymerase)